jgi:hypothetical protein
MRRELWPVLLAMFLLAETASAQTPPPSAAAATSPTVSMASLLADGFEIKAVNDISNDEQKTIWPTSPVLPYLMITLEKGTSIAVCSMAVVNWFSLPESSVTDKTLCHKR